MGIAHGAPLEQGNGRSRFDSLKARMALILVVVLAPPLMYSVWQAFSAYEERLYRQAQTLEDILKIVSAYENAFFDKTLRVLETLRGQPGVQRGGAICQRAIDQAQGQVSGYLHILVTDADGMGICATQPTLLRNVTGRPWFMRLKAGEPFVISQITSTGDDRTIVVGMPIEAVDHGGFAGSVSVGIDLREFANTVYGLELPAGGIALLVDSKGEPVVEPTSRGGIFAEAAPARAILAQVVKEGGGVVAQGRDGLQRTFVASGIAGGALYAVAGVVKPGPWAWLQRDLVIGIFAPTLMLTLAVVAIWIATEFLVNRHVRALAAAARAYSRGDLQLRAGIVGAPRELKDLAQVLSRMADRIQKRETELKASLAHKDVMLKEIHHRVKNNLQIVTSLLNLRARSIPSSLGREAVNEAQLRIRALALVHRYLYETDEVQYVELSGFFRELCELLVDANETGPARVALELTVDRTFAATDQAIPLALFTTEVVSNSYHHAFPEGRLGHIWLRLANDGATARLSISDDGVGMQDTASETRADEGFGLTLIRMFAKQIGGTFQLNGQQGTKVEINFPLPVPSSPENITLGGEGTNEGVLREPRNGLAV